MRADAVVRRGRILDSARELFALRGHDVALDQVAAHANVGVATLYRNFASREELSRAVAVAIMGDIVAAVDRCENDGLTKESWSQFLNELARLNLGAFTDAQGLHDDDDVAKAQQQTLGRVAELVRQFVSADVLRPEVKAQDLIVCIAIMTRPQPEAIRKAVPHASDQLLESYRDWTVCS